MHFDGGPSRHRARVHRSIRRVAGPARIAQGGRPGTGSAAVGWHSPPTVGISRCCVRQPPFGGTGDRGVAVSDRGIVGEPGHLHLCRRTRASLCSGERHGRRLHRDHAAAAHRAPCAIQCAGRGPRRARQEAPHPRYSQIVDASLPTLADAAGVVALAATLEEAATDTYIYNLAVLRDPTMRTLMARVMGVESQHLAVLQTFGALIAAGVPELVAIPTDVSALPMAIGSAAFPHALEITNFASFPAEGAVR